MGSMMKKTTLREIRGTLGRFMAILAIIALGTGFFTGVRVTTPAMVNMMDTFYNEHDFYDLRLVSTIGWDKESPEILAQEEDVRYAEGGISLDVLYEFRETEQAVLKTHMMPKNVNGIELIKGRMPEAPNEAVSDVFNMGTVITVSSENSEDVKDSLAYREITVVGRVRSSLYINFERGSTSIGNGSVDGFLYLPEEAFDCDYYNEIFVRYDHDLPIYSEEYNDFIEEKKTLMEESAIGEADARYDRIYTEALIDIREGRDELEEKRADGQRELDDAKDELDSAETELTDAKKELDDGAKEIADSEKKLSDAKKELDDGQKTLDKSWKELEDARKKLEDSKKQLMDGDAQVREGQQQLNLAYIRWNDSYAEFVAAENEFFDQYSDAINMLDVLPQDQREMVLNTQAQFDATRRELDATGRELDANQAALNEKKKELDAGWAEYEAGKTKYDKGLADYRKGKQEYDKGKQEYEDGLKQLEDGRKDYEKGLSEYEDGLKEYDSGKGEYADGIKEFDDKIAEAEEKLADAEIKLSELEEPDVYILDRSSNIGSACFENDSKIVEQVARVFPIFFILVAALVCMTTMSRMVEEQRTQIGMFKALGYSNGAIMGKFMTYSGTAAIVGCVLGFFGGTVLFPRIIWMTYKLMYIDLELPYMFDTGLFIAAIVVSLLCSIGTTWIACHYELAETAASLMRPKAPKAGKRVFLEYIGFIWNRLKFLHKVSVRNILRYKGRFFMMILGIGGCMALLLTGFGIKDSIAGFADTQFNEIQTADGEIMYDSTDSGIVRGFLSEIGADSTMFRKSSWEILYGNRVKSIDLLAFEDTEALGRFFDLRTVDGDPLGEPKLGEAFVSTSVANRYDAKKGSEITLRDSDMNEMTLTVAGVFENHVYNYIFISAGTYGVQTGTYPEPNGGYVIFPEGMDKGTAAALIDGGDGIKVLDQFAVMADRLSDMMSRLDYIVLLIIICAAALAFIVIYNLTNINITERKREIATIKVLGFFRHETSAYVLRENLVLTAIGIIVGTGLGVLLHRFVMAQIVVDICDFTAKISTMSFIYSIVLTFVFNLAVNLFMQFKLESINMAESLKSVD